MAHPRLGRVSRNTRGRVCRTQTLRKVRRKVASHQCSISARLRVYSTLLNSTPPYPRYYITNLLMLPSSVDNTTLPYPLSRSTRVPKVVSAAAQWTLPLSSDLCTGVRRGARATDATRPVWGPSRGGCLGGNVLGPLPWPHSTRLGHACHMYCVAWA